MNASSPLIAYDVMIMPSMSACGLAIISGRWPGLAVCARARRGPAPLLGDLQAEQIGRAGRGPFGGLAVGEAGQDPARLPPGAQVARAARRRDLVPGPQVVNELAGLRR